MMRIRNTITPQSLPLQVLAILAVFTSVLVLASADSPNRGTTMVQLRLARVLRYRAAVSSSDKRVTGFVRSANLMLPPQYNLDLCLDPVTTTDPAEPVQGLYNLEPIALLVPLSVNCSMSTQIQHASRLELSSLVRYLVFQSKDSFNPDEIPDPSTMATSKNMGLMFVSFLAGRSIRGVMLTPFLSSGVIESPYVGSLGNEKWSLPLSIIPPDPQNPVGTHDVVLYLIFLAIFLCVLVAPCTLFLCRRNIHGSAGEEGSSGGVGGSFPNRNRPDKKLLSNAQVMDLPVLVYRSDDGDGAWQEQMEEGSKGDGSGNSEEECQVGITPMATTSTMCSICIQDFEEGERIRVLPLCRHAYHYDCIYPWLTERAGSCPDCKAHVLCDPRNCYKDEDDEEDGALDSNGTSDINQEGATSV